MFHTMAELSQDPEHKNVESGEKQQVSTLCVWPAM